DVEPSPGDPCLGRARPLGCLDDLVAGHGAHVASPRDASTERVRSSTRACARSRSRPWILSGPAADAVVTVTLESPNSCSRGPRSVPTVWLRERGAIRRCCANQPACVYTAWEVASHR